MNPTARLHSLQNIYETALAISRDNQDEWVLCVNFLPWADMLVCSHLGDFRHYAYEPDGAQARWAVVSQYLGQCVSSARPQHLGMAGWDVGGCFEYWPTTLREQAHQDRGPFRFVIECSNPLERVIGSSR